MAQIVQNAQYDTVALTRDLAQQYITDLTRLANQIPQVEYTEEDILAEQKGNRALLNKWQHSLVIMDANKPIAFIIGYERKAEGNEQYPIDTLYISELSVAENYQNRGVARSLLRAFFEQNNTLGFRSLSGRLNYSLQTNAADWNKYVIDLYKSFGFKQRSTKQYPNRTDVILGANVDELELQ